MRYQLLHLSGPYRGTTTSSSQIRFVIGTSKTAALSFPLRQRVAKRHAEITFVERECSFHLKALEGRVFVNGREVREVILEDNDSLELGIDGPKLRFHIVPPLVCKPVRQMLRDAGQVRRERGGLAFVRALQYDLFWRSSRKARLAAAVVIVGAMFLAAYLGGAIGTHRATQQQELLRRREADAWRSQLASVRAQMQRQLEEFRHEQAGHVSRTELDQLRADLAGRAEAVDRMIAGNQALRRVLDVYSRGVCLIHGIFALHRPVEAVEGQIELLGPVEYLGSGFLATPEGHVITNRHVAQPWSGDETLMQFVTEGFVPGFLTLTATFPEREPIDIDPAEIRLSTEGVDVAVVRVTVQGVPALPLYEGDVRGFLGGRVIVLGYPAGLNGILARTEPDLAEEVLAAAEDTPGLIRELAARGAIVPIVTQGALNEVRPRRLVYDAETTSGGSGGPVFAFDGTVIGVNFAVTRDFGGSNFGVPIEFVRRLIESAPPTEPATLPGPGTDAE